MTRTAVQTLTSIALVAVLAAAVLAPGAAAVAPDGDATLAAQNGTDTPTATPTATPEPASGSFEKFVRSTSPGGSAEFVVSLENTDSATFSIGAAGIAYDANVTVTDGDDDGTVTLQFDTSKVDTEGAAYSVGDGDSVTVSEETTVETPFPDANYPITLYVDGAPAASSTLIVREPIDRSTPTDTPSATPSPTDASSTGVPGFGPIVAAVALVGAAALALRR